MFLLDQDDTLYRLPSAKFDQMLGDPTRCRLPRFAGNRVRMTDVAVELIDRQPLIDSARIIRELLKRVYVKEVWTKKMLASSREKYCKRDVSRWFDCTVEELASCRSLNKPG
jgi:hypothetical protein